jgi:hypothetical protein
MLVVASGGLIAGVVGGGRAPTASSPSTTDI